MQACKIANVMPLGLYLYGSFVEPEILMFGGSIITFEPEMLMFWGFICTHQSSWDGGGKLIIQMCFRFIIVLLIEDIIYFSEMRYFMKIFTARGSQSVSPI